MATLATRLRNEKRKKMAFGPEAKFRGSDEKAKGQEAIRTKLRNLSLDPALSDEDRAKARETLQGMPRNGSRTRVRSRCVLTGRGRAVYRRFGLCRNKFRELALWGRIPGVTKASW